MESESGSHRNFDTVYADVRAMTSATSLQHPSPIKTWRIAAALRHHVEHRFCHGPLVLYAAGHFVEFIRVMVFADIEQDAKDVPLIMLDEAVQSATALVQPDIDPDEYEHLVVDEPARHLRSFWHDYEIPSINLGVEEAYEQGWSVALSGAALPDQHDLRAAILAATNIEAPLAMRRSVVRRCLIRYLDHLDRVEAVSKGANPWTIPERLIGEGDALELF